MFLVLFFSEKVKNWFTEVISVYGKVPLFYFIVHLLLIHSIIFIMLFIKGFGLKELQFGVFKNGRPAAESGVELPVI
jgi:hypothetical protein